LSSRWEPGKPGVRTDAHKAAYPQLPLAVPAMITTLLAICQALPIIDKYVQQFVQAYNEHKFKEAEEKARLESNTEDLQQELGKHL
jgi:UPF0716 family protein affecting phage T7 exclusion